MGNTSTKPHSKSRHKKQVHWKAADRPSPPGKPQLVSETELDQDIVRIRWEPPRYDGGSPIKGYLVEHRRLGSPHWVRATPLLVKFCEISLSGLEPGWRYQFRISAENSVGLSAASELSDELIVTLQRTVNSVPNFTEELIDATALENDKTEFIAEFQGQPVPKVCWFKDGFEIFSSRRVRILTENSKSVLTIHQCSLSDEGEIKCTITNRSGHASSKARLTINAPPSIRLPRQYEDGLLFELGEVVRLKVTIAGRPPPVIFWAHNNESIGNVDHYEIETTEKYSGVRIQEAERSDRGEYQIKAINKLGEANASFLVTVTDKPAPPGQARVVMTLGRSVTLSWITPSDDGGCKIGNYIVEYFRIGWDVWLKAATCRQLTTTVGELIEGSQYKFRIKAESPYGVSEPSNETDVIFIPDPTRGLITPSARGRAPSREIFIDTPPRKNRSQSTGRSETLPNRTSTAYFYQEGVPVRPPRSKTKSSSATPEVSPIINRRTISTKSAFDRTSVVRDMAYGSPEIREQSFDYSDSSLLIGKNIEQNEIIRNSHMRQKLNSDERIVTDSSTTKNIATPRYRSPNEIDDQSHSIPTNINRPNKEKKRVTSNFQKNNEAEIKLFNNLSQTILKASEEHSDGRPFDQPDSQYISSEITSKVCDTTDSNIASDDTKFDELYNKLARISNNSRTPSPKKDTSNTSITILKSPSQAINQSHGGKFITKKPQSSLDVTDEDTAVPFLRKLETTKLEPKLKAKGNTFHDSAFKENFISSKIDEVQKKLGISNINSTSPEVTDTSSKTSMTALRELQITALPMNSKGKIQSPEPLIVSMSGPRIYPCAEDIGELGSYDLSDTKPSMAIKSKSKYDLEFPTLPREKSEPLSNSSEFMLLLVPEEQKGNAIKIDFEENSVPPPMSLSAPELGTEPPLFENLRISVSSTELLHEYSNARLYDELANETQESNIPKIQINSKEARLIVGLERQNSLRRRLSAGTTTPLHLRKLRTNSLRNSFESSDIPENTLRKFVGTLDSDTSGTLETRRELFASTRQRSQSEEREEEEFERVRAKTALLKQESGMQRKTVEVAQEEYWSEEESLSESESGSSNVESAHIFNDEDNDVIYRPRAMRPSSQEPFEILTKPSPLPDPNFVPKPILKRTEDIPPKPIRKNLNTNNSLIQSAIDKHQNHLIKNRKQNSLFTQNPSTDTAHSSSKMRKRGSSPTIPFQKISVAAEISGMTAASIGMPQQQPAVQRKSEDEEKVAVDHYGDILRSYGQRGNVAHRQLYLNTDDLKAAAEQSEGELINKDELAEATQEDLQQRELYVSNSTGRRTSFLEASSALFNKVKEHVSTAFTTDQVDDIILPDAEIIPTAQRRGSAQITKRRPSKLPITKLEGPKSSKKPASSSARSENWSNLRTPSPTPAGRNTPSPMRIRGSPLLSPGATQIRRNSLTAKPKTKEITTQTSDPRKDQRMELSVKTELKVRTAVDYITDLVMFMVACWLYLFHNELLAIPVLAVMVYRQLKEEIKKRLPNWMVDKKYVKRK